MYAVIVASGKQHRVTEGERLRLDYLSGHKKGDSVVFDRVLMLGGESYKVGAPTVQGAKVEATVLRNGDEGQGERGPKIRVYKKKNNGYDKTIGHRQRYTEVRIDKIVG